MPGTIQASQRFGASGIRFCGAAASSDVSSHVNIARRSPAEGCGMLGGGMTPVCSLRSAFSIVRAAHQAGTSGPWLDSGRRSSGARHGTLWRSRRRRITLLCRYVRWHRKKKRSYQSGKTYFKRSRGPRRLSHLLASLRPRCLVSASGIELRAHDDAPVTLSNDGAFPAVTMLSNGAIVAAWQEQEKDGIATRRLN